MEPSLLFLEAKTLSCLMASWDLLVLLLPEALGVSQQIQGVEIFVMAGLGFFGLGVTQELLTGL
jgi:hypothetical protein